MLLALITDAIEAQRLRRQVKQLWVLTALAAPDPGLHGRAVGDGLIRVDAAALLLAIEEVNELLYIWGAGGGADQEDLVDLVLPRAVVSPPALALLGSACH